jgi:hypothetical protein
LAGGGAVVQAHVERRRRSSQQIEGALHVTSMGRVRSVVEWDSRVALHERIEDGCR